MRVHCIPSIEQGHHITLYIGQVQHIIYTETTHSLDGLSLQLIQIRGKRPTSAKDRYLAQRARVFSPNFTANAGGGSYMQDNTLTAAKAFFSSSFSLDLCSFLNFFVESTCNKSGRDTRHKQWDLSKEIVMDNYTMTAAMM